MKHWVYYTWSIEYTTYEALGEQWDRFYNSGSYFADSPIILMGLSAKNDAQSSYKFFSLRALLYNIVWSRTLISAWILWSLIIVLRVSQRQSWSTHHSSLFESDQCAPTVVTEKTTSSLPVQKEFATVHTTIMSLIKLVERKTHQLPGKGRQHSITLGF